MLYDSNISIKIKVFSVQEVHTIGLNGGIFQVEIAYGATQNDMIE